MKVRMNINRLNINQAQWCKIENLVIDNYIEVTPQELIDLIGCYDRTFTLEILTKEEKIFVDEYYSLGKKMNLI